MTTLLPLLAVAFAAFCVWLGVRIVNRRERWAKGTAVGLVVMLAYPLSIGPASWISSHAKIGASAVSTTYRPITWIMDHSQPAEELVSGYCGVGAAEGWGWSDSSWDDLLEKWLRTPKYQINSRHLGIE